MHEPASAASAPGRWPRRAGTSSSRDASRFRSPRSRDAGGAASGPGWRWPCSGRAKRARRRWRSKWPGHHRSGAQRAIWAGAAAPYQERSGVCRFREAAFDLLKDKSKQPWPRPVPRGGPPQRPGSGRGSARCTRCWPKPSRSTRRSCAPPPRKTRSDRRRSSTPASCVTRTRGPGARRCDGPPYDTGCIQPGEVDDLLLHRVSCAYHNVAPAHGILNVRTDLCAKRNFAT
jgi:hypothetical protein